MKCKQCGRRSVEIPREKWATPVCRHCVPATALELATKAASCPACSHSDVKTEPDAAGYEYMTYCHSCYDADCVGDPPRFVSGSLVGHGTTSLESIEAWNEEVEMYEPTETLAGRQP